MEQLDVWNVLILLCNLARLEGRKHQQRFGFTQSVNSAVAAVWAMFDWGLGPRVVRAYHLQRLGIGITIQRVVMRCFVKWHFKNWRYKFITRIKKDELCCNGSFMEFNSILGLCQLGQISLGRAFKNFEKRIGKSAK